LAVKALATEEAPDTNAEMPPNITFRATTIFSGVARRSGLQDIVDSAEMARRGR
jgi:hypothetical protein